MQTASAEEFTVPHICFSRTLDTGIATLWAGCQMNMTTPHLKHAEMALCKVGSHINIMCLSPEKSGSKERWSQNHDHLGQKSFILMKSSAI